MPSFNTRLYLLLTLGGVSVHTSRALAQQQAKGFAVERFYPAPSGSGWLVMDDLDMNGRLGGAMGLTTGYAVAPLEVASGSQRLTIVSRQAFVAFGAALTHERWRFFLNLDAPIVVRGHSGTVGSVQYTAPDVTLGSHPDALSDARLGAEMRFYGDPGGVLRLGMSLELLAPTAQRSEYLTDDTFRGMVRALGAGDAGRLSYATQVGVHVRPLDDGGVPGSARGSELLLGAAAGAQFALGSRGRWALILGPEIYAASALGSLFGSSTTALEGILSTRVEGTQRKGRQLRIRLGAGAGLKSEFGAPKARFVLAVEYFNRDSRDAR